MGSTSRLAVAIGTLVLSACGSSDDNAAAKTLPATTTVPIPPLTDGGPRPPATGEPLEPSRVLVAPDSVELSADRQTLSVTTSYPAIGHCITIADGVEVNLDDGSAVVSAWMRSDTPAEGMCAPLCDSVTQLVTLAEPLPDGITFAYPDNAYPGCSAGHHVTTTTNA